MVRAMVVTEQPDTLDVPVCSDECRTAAVFVHEAFAEAIIADLDPRAFAEAAIAVGLEELVARYREDAVVEFVTRLIDRVRSGEFSDIVRH